MFKPVLMANLIFFSAAPVLSAPAVSPEKPARVDYKGFQGLTEEAGAYRQKRLVNIETFLKMAQEPNTMILDARSESAYQRKHLKNAVHLSFSDFSIEALKKTIPNPNTRILIYCNNNIDGDTRNFPTKMTPLALNIPTFINLYGYGYKNVYELSSLLDANEAKLLFEGTDVRP